MIQFDNSADILKNIQSQANEEKVRITQHAQQEMADEDISLDEVFEAIASGEILENYPVIDYYYRI